MLTQFAFLRYNEDRREQFRGGEDMRIVKEHREITEKKFWEEESGLIEFLSSVNSEVERFSTSFGFDIKNMPNVPKQIDGDSSLPLHLGFILERKNPLMPEFTYCLYSLLIKRSLHGYIGICRDGSLTTLKELTPIKKFKKGKALLYEWMSQLVRASCEKLML
jgi:hypothetical protein